MVGNTYEHSELLEGSDDTDMLVPEEMFVDTNISDVEQDICIPSTSKNLPSTSKSYDSEVQHTQPTIIPPGPVSPAVSTPGASKKSKRKGHDSSGNDYAVAIHNLAESMKEPITVNTIQNTANVLPVDPVDTFVAFMGSLLRTFEDEEIKLELMGNITQTIINAKSIDIQRTKKKK